MSSAIEQIKKFIPKEFKELAKESWRRRQFRRAFARYAEIPSQQVPSPAIMKDLISSWGNEGYSAMAEYLLALRYHASRTTGPILECGSGLSTLVLGLEGSRRGIKVWSLEHHPDWRLRMRREIADLGLDMNELCAAPLKDYGRRALN